MSILKIKDWIINRDRQFEIIPETADSFIVCAKRLRDGHIFNMGMGVSTPHGAYYIMQFLPDLIHVFVGNNFSEKKRFQINDIEGQGQRRPRRRVVAKKNNDTKN